MRQLLPLLEQGITAPILGYVLSKHTHLRHSSGQSTSLFLPYLEQTLRQRRSRPFFYYLPIFLLPIDLHTPNIYFYYIISDAHRLHRPHLREAASCWSSLSLDPREACVLLSLFSDLTLMPLLFWVSIQALQLQGGFQLLSLLLHVPEFSVP